MFELLSRSLGFVSASLVALIAIGFGAMFLFFSGSAALILGHFLRFVRDPRVALGSAAAGALVLLGLALELGTPKWWYPALAHLGVCAISWLLIRLQSTRPILALIGGGLLIAVGSVLLIGVASIRD